ncbi:hypothetical protein LXL04_027960 [Taraxacum kok-saghyz]
MLITSHDSHLSGDSSQFYAHRLLNTIAGMAKTRSLTRNRNHDNDASSSSSTRTRFKSSDLNDDVLFIIMMQLGIIDFFAFSGVCKSWRSFAVSKRNTFMASKPPMSIGMRKPNKRGWCHLEDFEGKKFKTILPHFFGRDCIGSTCGYLILFGHETRDFWLVNPVTRHELHFPHYPIYVSVTERMKGTLVFSPSISRWVFVVLYKKISFCIAGKRGWNHVPATLSIINLLFFKGKIYTLHTDSSLGEVVLKPEGKWRLLETKNLPNQDLPLPQHQLVFVSSGENLFVIDRSSERETVLELDFEEMKWVSPEKKTISQYAFFISYSTISAGVVKPESWLGHQSLDTGKRQQDMFNYELTRWYFPHECSHVNLLDE